MTTREFYLSVINGEVTEDTLSKAHELLTALDTKNAKRKTTPTKEQKEAAGRREAVLAFLRENAAEAFTRDAIAAALMISPAQATAACKALGDAVTKSEAKFDKKTKVVYQISA